MSWPGWPSPRSATRIARDLHDTLGHSLSVIAIKSELAGRLLPTTIRIAPGPRWPMSSGSRGSRCRRSARRSAATASRASQRSSRAPGSRSRPPGSTAASSRLRDGLPPAADAVLGWAVREGVTNVVRHSDAAAARRSASALQRRTAAVEIRNDRRDARRPGRRRRDAGCRTHGRRSAGSGLDGAPRAGSRPSAGRSRPVRLADGGFRLRVAVPIAMIRLLVAEDQALVRGAIVALLGLEPDLEVVADVAPRRRGRARPPSRSRPDVALLDIEMPGLDGLSAAAQLRTALPSCRVIVVTTFGRPGYLRQAMEAGASGFLLKDAPANQAGRGSQRSSDGPWISSRSRSAEKTEVLAAFAAHKGEVTAGYVEVPKRG